ncbi:abasic site processing protein HMCES [Venturia canescens]|uniref:abasic site processing protein HMCES n=1 Tax=Venturia canescens TaxID=32260 RepID=UPI001C9D2FEB|nr:abasic site processing protein HMCES [Venturia canescens]
MCGRITCYLAPHDLSCCCKHRDVSGKESEVGWVPEKFQSVRYAPSYNMGPRDTVACIVAGSHFSEASERLLCPMMWGMIPPWHKGEPRKHTASSHNARLEGLSDSKLYGKPLNQGKRCAIVINGFYEWKTDKQSGKKQPYYMHRKIADVGIHPEQQVLRLAGLFDTWTSPEGEIIHSCTILTTASNDVLSWLHHRAPVVLQTEKDVKDWLDYKNTSADKALAELRRGELLSSTLQWHPVASTVNNVKNKDKCCVDAVVLGKEKKKATSGLMSSWLKTGSITNNKRKSTNGEEDQDAQSSEPKTKSSKKN